MVIRIALAVLMDGGRAAVLQWHLIGASIPTESAPNGRPNLTV